MDPAAKALFDIAREVSADMTLRQVALLLRLSFEPGPHLVRHVAAAIGVSKPVITRATNSLIAAGLVSRRRDRNDARNCILYATEHGRATAAGLVGHLRPLMAHRQAA